MTFFALPNLLWLLLLAPIIVFFYLLKLKRREMTISSVMLWSRVIQDVQANAPFQKLRRNLLLLLQLLILLLAILALTRPAFFSRSSGGSSVVVVLDGSASMQSRDGGGGRTRFDAARARALEMVGLMRGGDRMMVVLAAARPHRLTPFTADRNALRAALNHAEPRDTTTDLRDATLLAASVAGQQAGSRIFVLSDGAFAEMEELDTHGAELVFEKFGERSNNVGIVALDARRSLSGSGGYQLFAAVRNYGPEPRKGSLELYRGDALIDARPLNLPAADPNDGYSEHRELLDDLPETTGILRARLDLDDDLRADNEAYAQLSTRQTLNVLLVTEGNLYLQNALNLDPQVKLSVVSPGGYNAQAGFDVTVFEGVGPKKLGPGSHLYIAGGGETAPVEIVGRVKDARVLTWERTHPVMRYVKLGNLDLPEALTARKRPWGVVLAEHESGPVIVVGERAGARSAYVGFPLLSTEFPLRVAFPIFFGNLVQWLAATPGKTEGMQLRAGQTAVLEVPAAAGEVTVTDPAGRRTRVRPEGRVAYFGDTERAGVYRVTAPGFERAFAVNLLSRDESDTRPRDRLQFGRRPVQAGAATTRSAQEVWRWLILAALLVLALEWWVFHRRL